MYLYLYLMIDYYYYYYYQVYMPIKLILYKIKFDDVDDFYYCFFSHC